ncbi:uncharacterized protein LOC117332982 [Pecten maximus]|uniref:uncharacterized protein LOC117332982 n=1 Tax=Pecten maximus TaxID=6579 RepID=UPI001458987D|nr:uncharacterized protein LOC117332982 [Pecten maximus]XP_033747965.1 uncharacterized protein LOC117332982 [Pecten maximus]XP_033747966.1 uncharacterized protein LOC117332982 [Pecten maximus]XP_033747967.1 uncharacterized protein LOC117332982 [Pecten maximus]XP_033747968.1 uncharacterized protein LOC117332982 [Pecten maximus]XP_033747969.1 uncharacterized protein LOC117332982 [Pecten maximus]
MEEVNTPILPEINPGFRVGGVSQSHEPPGRSWARIRTYLIDNPKDDDLKRRQDIWNYQQRNRGVVKSLMKSIPNVPYRVKKPRMDKFKTAPRGSQGLNHLGGDAEHGLHGIHLPRIERYRESPTRRHNLPPRDIPMTDRNENTENTESVKQRLTYKYTESDGVPVYEVETQVVGPRFPRMPDSVYRGTQNGSLLSTGKKVSFSLNDLPSVGRRVEIRGSSASSSSGSSVVSDGALGSYGPSSHHIGPDAPKSVWDYINNHQLGDGRNVGPGKCGKNIPKLTDNFGKVNESKTDREWFEKNIGDKEVINTTNYENFARTKPIGDHFNQGPPPPRRLPPNELALLRNKAQNNGVISNGNIPITKKSPPSVQSSPRSNIGLNIATKTPVLSPSGSVGSYFPIFSRDGSPMRKIGGTKKQKLQSLSPVKPPPSMTPTKSNTAE